VHTPAQTRTHCFQACSSASPLSGNGSVTVADAGADTGGATETLLPESGADATGAAAATGSAAFFLASSTALARASASVLAFATIASERRWR
jgi:hypothetical protein